MTVRSILSVNCIKITVRSIYCLYEDYNKLGFYLKLYYSPLPRQHNSIEEEEDGKGETWCGAEDIEWRARWAGHW